MFVFLMTAFLVVFVAVWVAIRFEGLSQSQRDGLVMPGILVGLGVILVAWAGYYIDPFNPHARVPSLGIYFLLTAGFVIIMLGARMIRSLLLRAQWAKDRGEPG